MGDCIENGNRRFSWDIAGKAEAWSWYLLYFETGNCHSSKMPSKAALNPTLLEPKTLRWLVNIYSSPFDAYLPLPWSEFEVTSSDPTESELTLCCTAYFVFSSPIHDGFHQKHLTSFWSLHSTEFEKALREPWPANFSEKPKWDVDCLSEWKQSPIWDESVSELKFNVAGQKKITTVSNFMGLKNFGNVAFLPQLRLLPPL